MVFFYYCWMEVVKGSYNLVGIEDIKTALSLISLYVIRSLNILSFTLYHETFLSLASFCHHFIHRSFCHSPFLLFALFFYSSLCHPSLFVLLINYFFHSFCHSPLFIVICSLCHSLFYNLFFCCSIRCFCHFLFFSWHPFWYFFNCLFVISHLLFSRCHSHFLSFALWPLLFLAHPFLSFAFYFVDLFGVWQKAIRTFCHSFFC